MPVDNLITMRRGLFLVSMPIFFINFAVPIQAKQLGASAVEIGVMFSLFTLSLLMLRPVAGWGLDRFGRKIFLTSAMLVYAGAHSLYANAESVNWMYLARFIQGAGAALMLISIDTLTTDLTDDESRAGEMGRNLETQTRSSIVGATIGFTLVGAVPLLAWQYTFTIYGIAALAAYLYLVLRLEESFTPTELKPADEPTPFVISRRFRNFAVVVFVSGFANALIQPIYLIYLQDRFDLPMHILAWAFLPAALVFAVLPSKAGLVRARAGDVNLLALGFVLAGIVYLWVPFLSSPFPFVALYTLSAVGWAFAEPARKALTATMGSEGATGRTFGLTELYAGIGATLGPTAGGLVYDSYGATSAFVSNGLLLFLAAGLTLVALRSDH